MLLGWLTYGLMWGTTKAPVVQTWVTIVAWIVHMLCVVVYTYWRKELAFGFTGFFLWIRVLVMVSTCLTIAFVPVNLPHFMPDQLVLGLTFAFLVIWYVEMILCGVLHPESTTDEYLVVIGISILRSEGVFVIIATTVIIMIRLIDFAKTVDFHSHDRAEEKKHTKSESEPPLEVKISTTEDKPSEPPVTGPVPPPQVAVPIITPAPPVPAPAVVIPVPKREEPPVLVQRATPLWKAASTPTTPKYRSTIGSHHPMSVVSEKAPVSSPPLSNATNPPTVNWFSTGNGLL